MNIRVMKTFCDVVDSGSFSRAAQESGISQSAVSQQLASLEREFSTQLLSRGGGLVVPTEAGKVYYQAAREIVRRYEQLLGEMRSAADSVRGILRVGTIYSVGFYLLDPYIRRFLQTFPEVNLRVEYTRWNRINAAVLSGEMDLGVVACAEKHRSIEIIPLANEELVVVCAPSHKLAKADAVDPADLKDRKFVAFETNVPTQRLIDKLLKAEGVAVNVVMEFDNIELLKRAVEVDTGITILPRENVEREVAEGYLVAVPFRRNARWIRPIAILRHRGKAPGPAERMFLAILRSKP